MNQEKFTPDKYYVLHGCPPTEAMVTPKEKRWMNWLVKKLQDMGLDATAPDLSVSWEPKYSEWKKEFEKYMVSEMTVIVAHSCGAAFIVRWLLETGKKIHKLVLVAPAKVPETEDDTRRDLYEFDLPSEVPNIADEVVAFTSNDFPHHVKSFELYKDALDPRVIRLEGKGHFLFFQMNTNEFPELLEEVLK
jgi:predicted alpha/beta hydrolase family esterase